MIHFQVRECYGSKREEGDLELLRVVVKLTGIPSISRRGLGGGGAQAGPADLAAPNREGEKETERRSAGHVFDWRYRGETATSTSSATAEWGGGGKQTEV